MFYRGNRMDINTETIDFIKVERMKLNELIVDKGLNAIEILKQSEKLDRLILVVQSQIIDREIEKYQVGGIA